MRQCQLIWVNLPQTVQGRERGFLSHSTFMNAQNDVTDGGLKYYKNLRFKFKFSFWCFNGRLRLTAIVKFLVLFQTILVLSP